MSSTSFTKWEEDICLPFMAHYITGLRGLITITFHLRMVKWVIVHLPVKTCVPILNFQHDSVHKTLSCQLHIDVQQKVDPLTLTWDFLFLKYLLLTALLVLHSSEFTWAFVWNLWLISSHSIMRPHDPGLCLHKFSVVILNPPHTTHSEFCRFKITTKFEDNMTIIE